MSELHDTTPGDPGTIDVSGQPPLIGYASLPASQTPPRHRRFTRFFFGRVRSPLWGFFWMAAFVGLFQLFYLGPTTGIAGWMTSMVVLVIASAFVRAARSQRIAAMLGYFEQAARLQVPLANFVRAAAESESSKTARDLTTIAAALDAGMSLGDALRSVVPALPLRTADLIRSAEMNGTLAPTLARLAAERSDVDDPNRSTRLAFPWAYLAMFLLVLVLTLTILLIFCIPKIVDILRDFGRPAPQYWRIVSFGLWALDPIWWLLMLVPIVCVLTYMAGTQARWIFLSPRAQERRPLRFFDRLRWLTPVIGGSIRDRDYADVCQTIADGIERRRPMDAILRDVGAQQHLSDVTLTRLDHWHTLVHNGQPTASAARAAHMPSLIYGLIGEHGDAAGTADAFAFLARHYRARALRRGDWLASALMPAITISCGLIVLGVAREAFTPIWLIIDATLPYKVGF